MSELDYLATVIENQHQRVEPEQFGLVSWPSCSCGRTETRFMPDGLASTGPAEYPCFALLELREHLTQHDRYVASQALRDAADAWEGGPTGYAPIPQWWLRDRADTLREDR